MTLDPQTLVAIGSLIGGLVGALALWLLLKSLGML